MRGCSRLLAVLFLITTPWWVPAAAAGRAPKPSTNDFILRAPEALIGTIAARQGLVIVRQLEALPDAQGNSVYLAQAPSSLDPGQIIEAIETSEPSVVGIEEAFLASLPETYEGLDLNQSTMAILGALQDPTAVEFGESNGQTRYVWQGYVNQPAAELLRVDEANRHRQGNALVAIIDSGIDPDHPLLHDNIVAGYDFTRNQVGFSSEWTDLLDQSTMAILGQSTMAILGGEQVVHLNQSTMAILGADQAAALQGMVWPPAFGHGTMVAGIIHRVAPKAKLMPLKAFDRSGQGHIFDIVRAVYFAVDHHANVINMSFSLEAFSPELMRAINYAIKKGVVCVSSVGNDGLENIVYPAGLGNAIGIASTTLDDHLSSFSNSGNDLVTVAAPGENLVTTYPGGGWALASGTSFAAPWISGVVAIFADKNRRGFAPNPADFYLSSEALRYAQPIQGPGQDRVGYGRADLKEEVDNLKSGLFNAASAPQSFYAISVNFGEGCWIEFPPASGGSACRAGVASQLTLSGRRVQLAITNNSGFPITLNDIWIRWPSEKGNLKMIWLGRIQIYNGGLAPPSASINSGWKTENPSDRQITGTELLEFEFIPHQ